MKFTNTLAICFAALCAAPIAAVSETYKESFDCEFDRGLANRPTPERVLFSLDELGGAALLHDVEIQGIDTQKRAASIKRNSFRLLSISWPGDAYTFSETGRRTRSGDPRKNVLDLGRVEFSLFLDRRTMQAIARSKTNGQASQDGNATGRCKPLKLS